MADNADTGGLSGQEFAGRAAAQDEARAFAEYRAPVPSGAADERTVSRLPLWTESTFVFVLVFTPDGILAEANQAAFVAAGLPPDALIGKHFSAIDALNYSPHVLAEVHRLLDHSIHGDSARAELTVRLHGGRLANIDCLMNPMRDASGRVVEMVVTAVEVSAQRKAEAALSRSNRELRMLSTCNQELVRAQSEAMLLDAICKVIVLIGGYPLAWVGFPLNNAERTVRPVARAGRMSNYIDDARISWADTERGQGPTGRALRERTVQICRDIEHDTSLAPWRSKAQELGLLSSISLPILNADVCFGALNIYSGQLDAFDESEVTLLRELAGDLGYGLAALRAHAARERAQAQLHLFRSLLDHSNELIYIVDAKTGRILDANDAVARRLGYRHREILKMNVADFSLTAGTNPWPEHVQRVRTAGALLLEGQHRTKSGTLFPVEISLKYVEQDDKPYVITVTRDITERRRQEDRIQRLGRVLRMQSSVNAAVLRIRDRDELLREACRVAAEVGGYDSVVFSLVDDDGRHARPQYRAGHGSDFPEPTELSIGDGTEPDTNLSSRALRTGEVTVCDDLSRSEPPVAMRAEVIARGFQSVVVLPLIVDGRRVGVLTLASRNADLVRDEELLLLRDVVASLSAALRSQQDAVAVQFLANFDPLTGLAKRSLLCDRLETTLRLRIDAEEQPVVAVFDVNHLSDINDSIGRHFGDLVLQRVAERLKSHAGSDDQLGYLGGGVFVLIDPQLGANEGAIAALLNRSVFGEPFALEGRSMRLSGRAGVARFPADGTDANTLLQRAEAALMKAKESGEQYLHYQLEMHGEIGERLELEHKLRAALDDQQFELYYQPQFSFSTGRLESGEALLRWNEPGKGIVPPSRFLGVLESTGLIIPVGTWVLGKAIGDCERWAQLGFGALRVAVNVSALQLRRRSFVPMLLDLNKRLAALPGWGLDIEITESVLLHDLDGASRKLRELRTAGVRVALDDFGTGYSALGLLPKLPVDLVKIDRSFVSGLPGDPPSMLLTESIIRLATALGLITVAEGVETDAQYEALRAMGCGCSQGYLHGPPVPRSEFERQLARR